MRRGFGPMRGPERVVAVDVAEVRHLPRELDAVFLLAAIDAAVLEQHEVAHGERAVPHAAVHPVADQAHFATHQIAETRGDRRQRIGFRQLAFDRTPEVRGHHDARATRQCIANRRDRRANPRVVGDASVVERYVEVGADEDPLAVHVDVRKPQEIHRSSMRNQQRHRDARHAVAVTWRPSAPSSRPACDSKIPIRYRTSSTPSRDGPTPS